MKFQFAIELTSQDDIMSLFLFLTRLQKTAVEIPSKATNTSTSQVTIPGIIEVLCPFC